VGRSATGWWFRETLSRGWLDTIEDLYSRGVRPKN
jgi:hypothetical protein